MDFFTIQRLQDDFFELKRSAGKHQVLQHPNILPCGYQSSCSWIISGSSSTLQFFCRLRVALRGISAIALRL